MPAIGTHSAAMGRTVKDDGDALLVKRPDPSETVEAEPDAYTTLDEALMESFPASDPIAIAGEHGRGRDGTRHDR